jgi:hypothetical protein
MQKQQQNHVKIKIKTKNKKLIYIIRQEIHNNKRSEEIKSSSTITMQHGLDSERERDNSTTQSSHDYDYPALCIPRALGNITHDELYKIIDNSKLGEISKIVIKPKEFVLPKWERTSSSSEPGQQTVCYNNIYIYFKKWNTHDPRVRKYHDNIMNGQSIKIVHNSIPTPIFWRCVAANFTSYRNKINNTDI